MQYLSTAKTGRAIGTSLVSRLITPCGRFSARFSQDWPEGEELVPARSAAQGRQAEKPCDNRRGAAHVMRGDVLQLKVAADSAMRVSQVAQWERPGAKSRFTGFAAPGKNSANAKKIVEHRAAPRAP
jgi:hypothetical protein